MPVLSASVSTLCTTLPSGSISVIVSMTLLLVVPKTSTGSPGLWSTLVDMSKVDAPTESPTPNSWLSWTVPLWAMAVYTPDENVLMSKL